MATSPARATPGCGVLGRVGSRCTTLSGSAPPQFVPLAQPAHSADAHLIGLGAIREESSEMWGDHLGGNVVGLVFEDRE